MTTGEHTVRALVTLVTLSAAVNAESEDAIDFEREIRPILSEHCYSCHGPDRQQRQAGLRLDRHQATRARLPSGGRAIVPGNPTKSLLWQRISSPDRAKRMPPINSKRSLELAEIELIRKWIQQGADWSDINEAGVVRPKAKDANQQETLALRKTLIRLAQPPHTLLPDCKFEATSLL
mgnify:CR=1 FL=1